MPKLCSRLPEGGPPQKKNNTPYTVPLLLTGVKVYQVTYSRVTPLPIRVKVYQVTYSRVIY